MKIFSLAACLTFGLSGIACAQSDATLHCKSLAQGSAMAYMDMMTVALGGQMDKTAAAAANLNTFLEVSNNLQCDPALAVSVINCFDAKMKADSTDDAMQALEICLKENGLD